MNKPLVPKFAASDSKWQPPSAGPQDPRRHRSRAGQWLALLVLAGGGSLALVAIHQSQKPTRQDVPRQAEMTPSPAIPAPAAADRNVLPKSSQPSLAEPEISTAQQATTETVPEIIPPPPTDSKETLSATFADEPLLVLTGIASTTTPERARDAELLKSAAKAGAWSDYRDFLDRSISAALPADVRALVRDQLWDDLALRKVFLRREVLSRFSEQEIHSSEHSAGFLTWFLEEPAAMEQLLLTLNPADDSGNAFRFLAEAPYLTAGLAKKYINLAIACAVVFDRPLKIVGGSEAERYSGNGSGVVDGLKRMNWYIKNSEAGKLLVAAERSSARDLVWVVSAPVPEAELDWALRNVRLQRKQFGEAYGMIEYLMERAVEGLNPYQEYTFAEIQKEGGICGDQSFFCSNTARAHGIPAMTLTGETDLGGHAWVAAKTKPDEWDWKIGRIGGVANGESVHPQTGERVSEQEVWLWNERGQKNEAVRLTSRRLTWLAAFLHASGKTDAYLAVTAAAQKSGLDDPEIWELQRNALIVSTAAMNDAEKVKVWADFASQMRAHFRDNPRMATLASKVETEFVFPHLPETEARKLLARERRRIDRNSGEQQDLIADSLQQEASLILSHAAPDAVSKVSTLYDQALRGYDGNITGFKRMADDYFSAVKSEKHVAAKAARDIELAFFRVVETGTSDWFRANTEVSIYKQICGYYREAGDEKRAQSLERRYLRILRDAERGALR